MYFCSEKRNVFLNNINHYSHLFKKTQFFIRFNKKISTKTHTLNAIFIVYAKFGPFENELLCLLIERVNCAKSNIGHRIYTKNYLPPPSHQLLFTIQYNRGKKPCVHSHINVKTKHQQQYWYGYSPKAS